MNNEQLPDSEIWFVRAERRNALADCFLEHGVVAMGWGIGPLDPDASKQDVFNILWEREAHRTTPVVSKWAREIRDFNQAMAVGDAVATYQPRGHAYHIGIIRSLLVPIERECLRDPKWDTDYAHQVEWLWQVDRDTLPKQYRRRNLDRQATLHRLSSEASEVLRQRCTR